MIESLRTTQIPSSGSQRFVGFSGGAQTRYKKYPCKGSCKRKSYETICVNIVSRYQNLVSSLPREAVFRRRRPKAHFMTGRTGSPVKRIKLNCFIGFHMWIPISHYPRVTLTQLWTTRRSLLICCCFCCFLMTTHKIWTKGILLLVCHFKQKQYSFTVLT